MQPSATQDAATISGSQDASRESVAPETVVPEEASALFGQALDAAKSGRPEEARENFKALISHYPSFSGPYVNLGLLELQEDDLDEARKLFLRALEVNPDNADAYVALGLLDRREGNFVEAEQKYLKAIALNPNHASAHLNLGIVYDLYMGKLSEAVGHYKTFQLLQPEPVEQVKFWIVDIEARLN